MHESWLSRHGTTLIALGAALVLGLVALVLWRPPWGTRHAPAPVGDPSNPGWHIRYDATIALARRGSPDTRLDILEEMLDEGTQRANFRTRQADGKETVDEGAANQLLDAALDATATYYDKTHDPKAVQQLKPAVEKLCDSSNRSVRDRAKQLLEKLT